jgi:hypothetical protein
VREVNITDLVLTVEIDQQGSVSYGDIARHVCRLFRQPKRVG